MKTVSLQLAKQLKEAGLKSNNPSERLSNFYWVENKGLLGGFILEQSQEDDYSLIYFSDDFKVEEGTNLYSAPTADEILDKLPGEISVIINDNPYNIWLEITMECNDEWKVAYEGARHIEVYNRCFADAIAKMWFTLKKEKLI